MAAEIGARHLIDGKLVVSETRFPVTDPAIGAPFAECPDASRAQLDAAVGAARAAFSRWSMTPVDERRAGLHAFAGRMRNAADAIAPLLTREQGKPIADARAEIMRTAAAIEMLSSLDISDSVLREDKRGRVTLNWRPLGVVAGIAPWNAPVALAMHKVAHALYTGNCLVLKPSPYTPLATLAVAALAVDLFPRGVLNVLAGGDALGGWLTTHPGIDKIGFTGSVATGRKVMASAGEGLKRVTLELGGNDPAIVLEDADLDIAAAGIARSAYANCGQICMAVKRVYASAMVHDALIERLSSIADAIRVGSGSDPATQMGPIQNRAQFDKISALINQVHATSGAHFAAGGTPMAGPGYFVRPAVVTGLDDAAPLVAEEQFGPVLPVLPFDTEDEAIQRANATRFGLGASVWSRDVDRAAAVAARLEAGSVWINRHGGNESDVPFGGAKESGIGREHGELGLRSYMELQVLTVPA